MRFRSFAPWLFLGVSLGICCGGSTPRAQAQIKAAQTPPKAPRKLALLIGISDYEKKRAAPPAWWSLNCAPDLAALKQVLGERFGFADKDILVLTDAQATRAGIIAAFEKHLIAQARPGDIIEFHYSGHGQQVKDDNGDELDGLDESLIPYDYISQSATDGAKTNLRDDTLGELLAKLKTKMQGADGKIKGNITMTFDCCFSGTATRGKPEHGRLRERGRGWNTQLDGPRPSPSTRGGGQPDSGSGSGLFKPDGALGQGYIVFSATQSDQTAKEAEDEKGRAMGAFTLYLTQALSKAAPGTTYRDIFERIDLDLKSAVSEQDPQIEGDINKTLFADAALPVSNYVVVRAARGDSLTLPVGSLHGATKGSRFSIFKAGTSVADEKNKIAEAEISSVAFTISTARLTEPFRGKLAADAFKAARAVETQHQFGDTKLKVLLHGEDAWAQSARAIEVLTTENVTDKNYDLKISKVGDELVIERKDGSRVAQMPDDAQAGSTLKAALLGEWRWQFLTQLRNEDSAAGVKIEARIVPVEVETDDQRRVQKVVADIKTPFERGGRLRFPEDTYVMLELRNPSRAPVYVTVLDLAADGSINPIFPHPDAVGVQENKIPADNAWHRIAGPKERPFVFRLGAPYGSEVFKVIATKEQSDFSALAYQKSITERGGEDLLGSLDSKAAPLGALLLSATTGQSTRGASFSGVPPTYWNTADVVFEVLPLE